MWYGKDTSELVNLNEKYERNLGIILMGKWNLSMVKVIIKIMFVTLKGH